jgi:hypothetical protein
VLADSRPADLNPAASIHPFAATRPFPLLRTCACSPAEQDDWNTYGTLTSKIGEKVQIVGDDLLVTNPVSSVDVEQWRWRWWWKVPGVAGARGSYLSPP